MSDLLYSDTEEALRDSVRRLFADRCPPDAVAGIYDAASQDFSGVWHTLAQPQGGQPNNFGVHPQPHQLVVHRRVAQLRLGPPGVGDLADEPAFTRAAGH